MFDFYFEIPLWIRLVIQGIAVIAVGVEAHADLPLLAGLGFDGATGPGLRQPS